MKIEFKAWGHGVARVIAENDTHAGDWFIGREDLESLYNQIGEVLNEMDEVTPDPLGEARDPD